MMNKNKKIAIAGCKHTTKELIQGLLRQGYTINHCITISPQKGEEQEVAGYYDLTTFLQREGIAYTVVKSYNLKAPEDKELLLSLEIDLLLVMGWQRLIPDWFLNTLSIGAFGMHGSSKPLPHGRGRSPMNWSLIQNKNIFYTHLFKYSSGVDDGPIVDVQCFDINEFDTCLTLHKKNTLSMIKLCEKTLPSLLDFSIKYKQQSNEAVSYYPKRSSEDGIIFWQDTTLEIYNLIRAVTHPFPGAFTFLEDTKEKIFIWKAIPFDTQLNWNNSQVGEILEVFEDATFIVKTSDATLLVLEYDGAVLNQSSRGKLLSNLTYKKKVWENLPQ